MTAVHEAPATARQKYARTNPLLLNNYLVSHRRNHNQAAFKQSEKSIVTNRGFQGDGG